MCIADMSLLFIFFIAQKSLFYVSIADTAYVIKCLNLAHGTFETLLISERDVTSLTACSENLVAYRTNDGVIRLYETELKTSRALEIDGKVDFPCLSHDGEWLLFCLENPGLRDDWDVMLYDIHRNTIEQLTDDNDFDSSPSFMFDKETVVFSRGSLKNATLYALDVVSKKISTLVENKKYFDFDPSTSPDNKRIAFSSNRSGNFDLWVLEKDTKRLERVTEDIGLEGKPIWLSDHEIIYEANHPDHWSIWLLNLKSKEKKRLTPKGEKCRYPAVGY